MVGKAILKRQLVSKEKWIPGVIPIYLCCDLIYTTVWCVIHSHDYCIKNTTKLETAIFLVSPLVISFKSVFVQALLHLFK